MPQKTMTGNLWIQNNAFDISWMMLWLCPLPEKCTMCVITWDYLILFVLTYGATWFNFVQRTSIRIMLTFLFYMLKSSHAYGKGLISFFFYLVLSNWNAKGRLYKWKLDYDHKSLPCVANLRRELRMKRMNIWVKWHR